MTDLTGRHAWLIGARSGMGLEFGRLLVKAGWTVTVSARGPTRLHDAATSDMAAETAALPALPGLFPVHRTQGALPMNQNHVQRYIEAFEHLNPSTLQPLEGCFAERARFVDPFNDVRGKSSIRRVFEHN